MDLCPQCGLLDPLGQFEVCPVCSEGVEPKVVPCYFLRLDNSLCRLDNTPCPHMSESTFDLCHKLAKGEEKE